MKLKPHLSGFFLSLIILLLSANSPAQTTEAQSTQITDEAQADIAWIKALKNEVILILMEYRYYGDKYDDSSQFPQARQQELLHYFENSYLNTARYQRAFHNAEAKKYNPLIIVPNVIFAKLFLSYASDPFYERHGTTPIEHQFSTFGSDRTKDLPKFNHEKIIAILKDPESHGYEFRPWSLWLATPDTIALAKLFLALGDDINFNKAIKGSLYVYSRDEHDSEDFIRNPERYYIYPDKIHRADDIIAPHYSKIITSDYYYKYFRTPVTYWLEEFIEAGYPASMLDTHKLHYPHFMKDASVAQVTEMLENPDAHKIANNINCPYKAEAMDCPLTPSINMRDAMGRTPLHIAGEQGNKAVFDALIKIGADKSIKDYRGLLPKI